MLKSHVKKTTSFSHEILPVLGPIDLSFHDLPHNESHLEWWYFHGHLESTQGKKRAFFVSFFRVAKDANVFPFEFSHSLA